MVSGNSSLYSNNPSGLVVGISSQVTDQVMVNNFFGLGDVGGTIAFPVVGSPAMGTVYGVTNTAELELFVYASKMNCRLVVPAANLTGTMYRGKMRLGQMFDSQSLLGGAMKVTVANLISASDHIQAMQSEF